nr:zinc finger, CCHC-type [Tanacetum cinerariifolium]
GYCPEHKQYDFRSIFKSENLTGPNFMNWHHNLRIVLRSENRLVHLEQPLIPLPLLVASQEDDQPVSHYLLKMKGYLDTLERLGFPMPNELSVSLILNSLNKDYDQFIQNYNMHSIGTTIAGLLAMLKLHRKGIPKKAATSAVLAIRGGIIQKDNKKL